MFNLRLSLTVLVLFCLAPLANCAEAVGAAQTVHAVKISSSADFCPIYPIALPINIVNTLQPGDHVSEMPRGTGPGNYSWLSWTGAVNAPTLAQSMLPPGDSNTYTNPDDGQDHLLEIGDWAQGATGSMNARAVRDNLDALLNQEIILPVWSEYRGQGSNLDYRVINDLAPDSRTLG